MKLSRPGIGFTCLVPANHRHLSTAWHNPARRRSYNPNAGQDPKYKPGCDLCQTARRRWRDGLQLAIRLLHHNLPAAARYCNRAPAGPTQGQARGRIGCPGSEACMLKPSVLSRRSSTSRHSQGRISHSCVRPQPPLPISPLKLSQPPKNMTCIPAWTASTVSRTRSGNVSTLVPKRCRSKNCGWSWKVLGFYV